MRKKVAVLFGGCSSEYAISLQSAHSVITHMDESRFEPVLLGITRQGEWFHYTGAAEKIKDDTWHDGDGCTPAVLSPCRGTRGVLLLGKGGPDTIHIDAALPMLHGKNGEDGTVQGLLELAGIPVIGCKTLCSALCMDKDRAHKIVALAGVRTPRAFTLARNRAPDEAFSLAKQIGYPLFVKPVRAGSSFGITKVCGKSALPAAIRLAFEHDDAVIIEENIPGFEVGCALLGSDEPTVGEVDEIELAGGLFDHKEKYTLETARIYVPARVAPEKAEEIKRAAKTIYQALGCSGFARVDCFLTPTGEIVFNEVNTIPGFTPHSRFPGMLAAAGMTMAEIVNTAIALETER